MKGFRVLCVSLLAAVVMLNCSQSPVSSEGDGSSGRVAVTIQLGKVGSLAKMAKTAAITLDSLTLDFSASGEANIHQMIPISGSAQQTVTSIVDLAANKNWTMQARTWDDARPWTNLHYGSTSFDVVEGVNPGVSLSLSAIYSMLMVRINPVPDSSTFMALSQGNDLTMMWEIWDDTTYSKGAKPATDTVKLYYDWLNAGNDPMMPTSQNIQVVIRGVWEGTQDVDLYWGTLNIPSIVSGVDANYSFNLNWIGPSSTTGEVPIEVIVGSFGSITADATPINP